MEEIADYLLDNLYRMANFIFGSILDGLAFIFNMLPVPEFMKDLPSYTLPPEVAYYAQYMQLEFGLSVIVIAYTLRFIIRRLPVIG